MNEGKEKDFLHEILEEITDEPVLTLFFKRLFEDLRYSRLFFSHRDQLFPTQGNVRTTFLFWNSIQDPVIAKESLPILSTAIKLGKIRQEQASDTLSSIIQNVGARGHAKKIVAVVLIVGHNRECWGV